MLIVDYAAPNKGQKIQLRLSENCGNPVYLDVS